MRELDDSDIDLGDLRKRYDSLRDRYEALQRRTRALFDANPDMIFRMDREGRYLDYHSSHPEVLLFRPDQFLGRSVDELFDAKFAAEAHTWIERTLSSNTTQYWEYSLCLHGEPEDFEARLIPSGDDEVIAIIRNITDIKRNRERLRAAEARLRRAQLIAQIGTWERDLATDEVWWSDQTYRLLELDRNEIRPSYATFLERVHPDDRPHIMDALQRSIDTRTPYSSHERLVFPDGTLRILCSHAHVECDAQGNAVRLVGTIQDITDRVNLEREIISVGERERERISRDLHDGLGQTLTGVSLSLKALANRLAKGEPPPWDILRQLEANVQQAIHETRRVTHLLSPRISGLPAALEALARQLDQPGMRCTTDSEADHDRHDPDVEAHLYRIAQEALSNAVRHSGARNIGLHYRCDRRSIRLEITDDGKGFCPDEAAESGLGLRNMRYRARLVNGNLDILSAVRTGTRVVFSCPCRCPAPLRGLEEAGTDMAAADIAAADVAAAATATVAAAVAATVAAAESTAVQQGQPGQQGFDRPAA